MAMFDIMLVYFLLVALVLLVLLFVLGATFFLSLALGDGLLAWALLLAVLIFSSISLSFFALVRKQEVQTFIFRPSIFLACRLICCRRRVLIFEWERLAPLVALRPQISHFFAIN